MTNPDVRWKQRLSNFLPAFDQLKAAVELAKQRTLSDLEKQGLIQSFEFTHELAWNVMKDYLDYQGSNQITGSRDATREAFQRGLIEQGDQWMEMIKSRNQTSHTYNKNVADEIVQKIQTEYFDQFAKFLQRMTELSKK
jgi:nucleotidyltransferase substrate binding protein (TIGR01987 family)